MRHNPQPRRELQPDCNQADCNLQTKEILTLAPHLLKPQLKMW